MVKSHDQWGGRADDAKNDDTREDIQPVKAGELIFRRILTIDDGVGNAHIGKRLGKADDHHDHSHQSEICGGEETGQDRQGNKAEGRDRPHRDSAPFDAGDGLLLEGHLWFSRDDHVHPRPLFCFVNPVEQITEALNEEPDRRDDRYESQGASVKAVNIVNE